MPTRVRLLLWVGISVLAACHRTPKERWVIPKGYVGWLRLDYGIATQPALPIENGRYLVRMPPAGRMQTSSAGKGWIGGIEYVVEDSAGGHTLEWFQRGLNPRYGVQNAFMVSRGPGSHKPIARFTCVFVGTRTDYRADGRNCFDWEVGQPEPPKYKKHLTVPRLPS